MPRIRPTNSHRSETRKRTLMAFTLEQIILQAAQKLATVSCSARLDAEVLAMHVCNLSRTGLITQGGYVPDPMQAQRLDEVMKRRLQGEPISYITGRREFWSLDLQITPEVLIPRPETELLVEQALARIPNDANWLIADLGTGSGAVALALAHERPHCRVLATDTSRAALTLTQANAQRLGLRNLECRTGDWLTPLAGEKLDMIVSNPPYIAETDPHLCAGDLRFEPRAALTPGGDGLDAIRCIIRDSRAHMRPNAWLLLEHGYDQGIAVRTLFAAQAYRAVASFRDTSGQERVTIAAC